MGLLGGKTFVIEFKADGHTWFSVFQVQPPETKEAALERFKMGAIGDEDTIEVYTIEEFCEFIEGQTITLKQVL